MLRSDFMLQGASIFTLLVGASGYNEAGKSKFILIQKVSDNKFLKFNQIVNHHNTPLEIKLMIWEIMINTVLDISQISNLIELKLSKKVISIFKKLDLSMTLVPSQSKLTYTIRFNKYPKQFLSEYQLQKFINLMKQNEFSISSLIINEDDYWFPVGTTLYISDHCIDSIFQMAKHLSCKSTTSILHYLNRNSQLKSLTIHDYFGVPNVSSISKVKLVVDHPFTDETNEIISKIFKFTKSLQTLIIKFGCPFESNREVASPTFHKLNVICLNYSHVKVRLVASFEAYNTLNHFEGLQTKFTSIELPLTNDSLHYSQMFPCLNQLGLNFSDNYDLFQGSGKLTDSTLRSLNIESAHMQTLKELRLNFSKLSNLRELCLVGLVLENIVELPLTLIKLKLDNCQFKGTLYIPDSLREFRLTDTYQLSLKCSPFPNDNPSLNVYLNYERHFSILGIFLIRSIEPLIKQIIFQPKLTLMLRPIRLTLLKPTSQSRDSFIIQFAEHSVLHPNFESIRKEYEVVASDSVTFTKLTTLVLHILDERWRRLKNKLKAETFDDLLTKSLSLVSPNHTLVDLEFIGPEVDTRKFSCFDRM